MTVSNALKLTCLGMTGGVVLRLVTMLYFYDYATGFFIDNGLLAAATIIFIAVIWVVSLVMCLKDKQYFFDGYMVQKNMFAGSVSLLSAAILGVMSVNLFTDSNDFFPEQYSDAQPQGNAIHMLFIILSFLMAVLQLTTSAGFFTGKNLFAKAPALQLAGIFWGIINVLFTFLFYAKSAVTTENIYMIIGSVSLLFALLYIGKLIVGFGDSSTAKRLYALGIPAVMLNITYNLSNLVLNLLGKNYMDTGETPLIIQAANLCVALYVLSFMFTFRKYSLKSNTKSSSPRDTAEDITENKTAGTTESLTESTKY